MGAFCGAKAPHYLKVILAADLSYVVMFADAPDNILAARCLPPLMRRNGLNGATHEGHPAPQIGHIQLAPGDAIAFSVCTRLEAMAALIAQEQALMAVEAAER